MAGTPHCVAEMPRGRLDAEACARQDMKHASDHASVHRNYRSSALLCGLLTLGGTLQQVPNVLDFFCEKGVSRRQRIRMYCVGFGRFLAKQAVPCRYDWAFGTMCKTRARGRSSGLSQAALYTFAKKEMRSWVWGSHAVHPWQVLGG